MDEVSSVSTIEILARLSFVTSARLEVRAADEGISIQQMRLLGILRDREPTINDLSIHMGLDKSSVSGQVIRAERRGLVCRVPDELDRRSVRVRLEPAGRAIVDSASARFESDMHQVLATLTEAERTRWIALTTRLLMAATEGSHLDF